MDRRRSAGVAGLVALVAATTFVVAKFQPSKTITAGAYPTIAAAGDISCEAGPSTNYCRHKAVSDLVYGKGYAAALLLGDNQYEDGTLAKYQSYFGPTWGRFKSIIKPAPGNHDYLTGGAAGYFGYFGASAGEASKGYYAFSLDNWRIYAINSNCSKAGGCANGSPQQAWLKADLAKFPTSCVLAYWHHPRFSSGQHGGATNMGDIWTTLYNAGADVVLSGHNHDYERFSLQSPSGTADSRGVRQFVVGTGGKNHYAFPGGPTPNTQVRNSDTFGILSLTLRPDAYDFQFIPEAGKSFTDSGSQGCHHGAQTSPSASPSASASATVQPTFPIRAAFYYPWFPEAWTQKGIYPYTNYHPSLGYYDSRQLDTVRKHIDAMRYGNIEVGISSWWGINKKEDLRVPVLLQAAQSTPFRWTLYYEPESLGDPTPEQIRSDLQYIKDRYSADPAFLKIGGKFVVFVYASGSSADNTCAIADRWKQANTVGAYVVLKVFGGYRNCLSQPQGWHQYAPAVGHDRQSGYSYAISPGFWLKGASERLVRDLARWKSDVAAMAASPEPWHLVTTFNEWGEGTSVESASEWSTSSEFGAYLDVLHAIP